MTESIPVQPMFSLIEGLAADIVAPEPESEPGPEPPLERRAESPLIESVDLLASGVLGNPSGTIGEDPQAGPLGDIIGTAFSEQADQEPVAEATPNEDSAATEEAAIDSIAESVTTLPDREDEDGATAEEAAINGTAEGIVQQTDGEPSEMRPVDSNLLLSVLDPTADLELHEQPPDEKDEAAPGAERAPEEAQQHEDGDGPLQEQQHEDEDGPPQSQQEEDADQQRKKPRELTGFIGMMGMFYYRSGKEIPVEMVGEPVLADPPGMMGMFDWHRENRGVFNVLAEFG
jgi:hypothetical protein